MKSQSHRERQCNRVSKRGLILLSELWFAFRGFEDAAPFPRGSGWNRCLFLEDAWHFWVFIKVIPGCVGLFITAEKRNFKTSTDWIWLEGELVFWLTDHHKSDWYILSILNVTVIDTVLIGWQALLVGQRSLEDTQRSEQYSFQTPVRFIVCNCYYGMLWYCQGSCSMNSVVIVN